MESGAQRARVSPWRADRSVAQITPTPGGTALSADLVRRCVEVITADRFSRAVTVALPPAEQVGFLAAGFEPAEELHLLSHDLRDVPVAPPTAVRLRRAWPRDILAVLGLDTLAFPPFWRLDRELLDEAIAATPHTRFRVAVLPARAGRAETVIGYAVTGRAGRRGYLQRLAVHPAHRRQGAGMALVADSLRWLRRWQGESIVVNTPVGNAPAVHLYERAGFRMEQSRLCVLALDLRR